MPVPPPSEELEAVAQLLLPAIATCAIGLPIALVGLTFLRKLAQEVPECAPRWGVRHALGVGALGLFAMSFASLLQRPDSGVMTALYLTVLVHVVIASAVVWVALRSQADGLRALGLRGAGAARATLAGGTVYLFGVPLLFGVGVLWPLVGEALGWEMAPQEILEGIGDLAAGALLPAILIAVVVAPFLEELTFRGFLQPALERWTGAVGGNVLTSLCFSLLHGLTPFLLVFVLSLYLGAIRRRTRSLLACWLVHGAHNGITLTIALL